MSKQSESRTPLHEVLGTLIQEAHTLLCVPESAAQDVARIVLRNLHDLPASLGASERARVRAYYRTVIHRRCLRARSPEFTVAAARIMLGAIRADLRAGGWDDVSIDAEIAASHGHLLIDAGSIKQAVRAA